MAEQGVRFDDKTQEIEPSHSLDHTKTENDPRARQDVPPEIQKELRDLSISMQKSHLQSKRMENFAFEPVSLPASRAPSPSPQTSSRPASGRATPAMASPIQSAAQSPPLTPAASDSKEEKLKRGHGSAPNMAKKYPEPTTITPQMSPPTNDRPRQGPRTSGNDSRPSSSGKIIAEASGEKNVSRSAPGSRASSPARKAAAGSGSGSGKTSPRAVAFAGSDVDKSRRPPQAQVNNHADTRSSVSSAKDSGSRKSSLQSAEGSHHKRDAPADARVHQGTRKSGIFSGLYNPHPDEEKHHHSGSMHDLKRFFKFGHKHKHGHAETSSKKSSVSGRSGTQTPPHHRDSAAAVPFSDDHGLESKYGKFGKVLGSGAGGSVRLIKRASDGTTFAVKQFRARHTYESEKDYNKKVTAEFCVGSTLHHGNIIETLDIIQEKGHWYEVMEYAPYDLFACVMTGKMSREEVTCCFMQIMNGVEYLHSMGLAHRDLKLDNVVVNDKGIMKLIDFGSAVMYRYPFEDGIVKASGIVGSDPYLAPEVYDEAKYDPRAVDVWSLGIIFCCMALRRFPWKLPRTSDVSYKYFVSEPSPGAPSVESLKRRTSTNYDTISMHSSHHHHHDSAPASTNGTTGSTSTERTESTVSRDSTASQQSLRGPWRLLRLLPRESRYCIGRMLDTDPQTRATMEEIMSEPWIAQKECCYQDESGKVHRIPGHDHVLEPSGGTGSEKK